MPEATEAARLILPEDALQVGDHLRQTPAPAGEPKIVHREAWYANLIPAKAFFQGCLKNLGQFWEGKAKFPDDQAKARVDSQMAETMTYFDKVYEGAQGGEGGKR
jgi:hypothetical protein